MVTIPGGSYLVKIFTGLGLGIGFSLLLFGFDTVFRRFNLRSFNVAIIGLFFGYLMGQALVLIFGAILDISAISNASPQILEIIKIALFLFGLYLGTIMTMRSSDEIYISIPFVKLAPAAQKKRDLLVDMSVLADARILDISSTGLFDNQLVVPRFVIKELYAQSEVGDEINKAKSRRALDVVKKLEALQGLDIRFNDTDFPDVHESTSKMIRLARLLDANLLTADISRVQMATLEGVRVINIHTLSNALKPLMQTGELIKIKIQRYGKEPRQGVGYLDDGTMVVVNGGGDFIGEIIEAQVLSVKHTTSGRMIFCNASDEDHPGGSYHHDEHDES
ncbi:MAG: TRAM domain-containing protein [Simkania sp.]|nr:TRAM domain-containing protein [Simkania sp.]